MKYQFFLLLWMFSCAKYHSQLNTCNLDIQYDSSEFANTQNITFDLKNITNKKIKIPEKINSVFVTIEDLEFLNIQSNNYIKAKFNIIDVDCFNKNCYGKMIILKPKNKITYFINLRNKFSFKEKGLYRFKIRLDMSFSPCDDFITNWIYYKIE